MHQLQPQSNTDIHCPCCLSKRRKERKDLQGTIYQCSECEALYGRCYLGDSYGIVKPEWADNQNLPAHRIKYFDLTCLGSEGLTRRHGWFDPETRKIVQIG
jgi:hypothetical protein